MSGARARAAQRLWSQLELFVPASQRWSFTRPWLVSPHRPRALRELEAVRAHFPELEGIAVKVGLTKRRSVLGLASMGEAPMIWIRPRRIRRFAIAHELVHLLQARGLVPGGEMSADLHALARTSEYVDTAPFYLRIPRAFLEPGEPEALASGASLVLHRLAAEAVRETAGARTARAALARFHSRAERAASDLATA